MSVRIARDYGIVVRRDALARKGMEDGDLFGLFETSSPHDRDAEMFSFGPHFGQEAADEFIRRLKAAGLEYVTDFWCFGEDVPDWCEITCSAKAYHAVG